MDDADRQYFECMDRLFDSADWKVFAGDINGWLEAISSQWATLRPDQLQFEQGRYDAMKQIVGYPALLAKLKDDVEAPSADITDYAA